MSANPHDTPRVKLPLPPGAMTTVGYMSTTDYLFKATEIVMYYTNDSLGERVNLRIGESMMSLPPHVWALIVDGLQQVLPAQGQQLTGYTACEGITAVNA